MKLYGYIMTYMTCQFGQKSSLHGSSLYLLFLECPWKNNDIRSIKAQQTHERIPTQRTLFFVNQMPQSCHTVSLGAGMLADFLGLLWFVVFRFMVKMILSRSTVAVALELAPLTPSQQRFGSVVKLFASICHESHLPSGLNLCRECLGMVCNGMHSAVRTEGCNHL